MRVMKKEHPERTDYDKALSMLISFIPLVQLKHNIRVYQLYELLKEAKMFIKFSEDFKKRLLYNEKIIIDYEVKERELQNCGKRRGE